MSAEQPSAKTVEEKLREVEELLRASRIQFRDSENRANREASRADQEASRADQEASQRKILEAQAEQKDVLLRSTTFEELLEDCHEILFKTFKVETVLTSCTKGPASKPEKKPCPTNLKKWVEFPEQQQDAFDQFYRLLHPSDSPDAAPRLFLAKKEIQGVARLKARVRMSSEMDLRYWQHHVVEEVLADFFATLSKDPHFSQSLGLGDGVSFDNQINTLNDNAPDVKGRQGRETPPPRSDRDPQPTFADMLCVKLEFQGSMRLLFPSEYKPPHKVTKEMFRVGLRPMNVFTEVVNKETIPTDTKSKEFFVHHAEKTVAAVVAQTYRYMLESGCKYGCLITGECIVFLRLLEEDSTTLYYHLSEPMEQVRDKDGTFLHMRTAIAQMISLIHMAGQSENRSPVWCSNAIARAKTWAVDLDEEYQAMPSSIRNSPPESPAYVPEELTPAIIARSPYLTRKFGKKAAQDHNYRPGPQFPPDESDDSDDSGGPVGGRGKRRGPSRKDEATPTKQPNQRRGKGNQQPNWQRGGTEQHRKRPYCTQKCLLGLIQASALDPTCPHFESHRRGGSSFHQISQQQLCTQVQQQLGRNLDYNCTDLQIQGSRCMLFKVSLASHGYTFVAKGTRDVFVVDLKREGQMYDRLHSAQGIDIPVHLGSIDLSVPWCAIGGVRVIYMLLLAYGGVSLNRAGKIHNLDSRVLQFQKKIALLGVNHGDLELRNMLWNPELQCVLFIDFERSTLTKDIRALREISPNRQLDGTVPRTPTKKLKSDRPWFEIYEDQPLVLPFPSPVKETQAARTPLVKGKWDEGDKENSRGVFGAGLED
ncbi:hypothetical protein Q9189_006686 [Teloschistes chrysophthalmus]